MLKLVPAKVVSESHQDGARVAGSVGNELDPGRAGGAGNAPVRRARRPALQVVEGGDSRVVPGRHSFEKLILPLLPDMTRFASKLAGSEADGADIVQSAMLRAMAAWPRWASKHGEEQVDARAWLYKIINHVFLNHQRDERLRKAVSLDSWNDYGDDNPDYVQQTKSIYGLDALTQGGAAERWVSEQGFRALSDEVIRALEELSDDHRQIVVMHYVREMTCSTIAEQLGIAVKTAFTRLHRARAELTKILARFAAAEYRITNGRGPTSKTPAVVVRKKAQTVGPRP